MTSRPLPIKLDDEKAERVRLSHQRALEELQAMPAAGQRVIANVLLANGVRTTVKHGLGRSPTLVTVSVPRGATAAGYIVETRDGVDLPNVLVLTANGYGSTVTVDVSVQ